MMPAYGMLLFKPIILVLGMSRFQAAVSFLAWVCVRMRTETLERMPAATRTKHGFFLLNHHRLISGMDYTHRVCHGTIPGESAV